MRKKALTCFAVVLTMMFMAAPAQGARTMIQICGATSGGTYFLLANAIAQMVNTRLPDDFKANAQSTAGTPINIRLMEKKEADFAFGQAGVGKNAIDGTGGFEQKFTNLASATYVYPNVMQVVVPKEANIDSFDDFKGKSFAVGASGSATEMNSRDMAQAYGLDYMTKKDLIPEYSSESQSVELVKNRQAVGANLIAAIGAATVMELMSSGKYEIINFSDEKIDALHKINSAYFKYVIPPNTYPNQPEAVTTFAVANYIFCRKDLPVDIVYKFTKALYDYKADLVAVHKAAGEIKKENAVNGLTVPLHPGAEKYFKEIGAIK